MGSLRFAPTEELGDSQRVLPLCKWLRPKGNLLLSPTSESRDCPPLLRGRTCHPTNNFFAEATEAPPSGPRMPPQLLSPWTTLALASVAEATGEAQDGPHPLPLYRPFPKGILPSAST